MSGVIDYVVMLRCSYGDWRTISSLGHCICVSSSPAAV